MIKYETIISNFDDKTTLYNWLRKVEEALKNASATNFVVNKKGNATLSFSITFADGTTLESGDIVLQQGESVDGARIASGVLQLHLTNGTWLTAGNLGAVSGFSIDASQHLIVTYQDGTTEDLGAIFTGNVNIAGNFTADSIIENMTGYVFTQNWTGLDLAYVGVVKNGNKITFAIAGKFKGTEGVDAYGTKVIGRFNFPSDIGAKLYPIGSGSTLSYSKVSVFSSFYNDIAVTFYINKDSNAQIHVNLATVNAIASDYEGQFRFEVTFLLSENLLD